MMRKKRRHLRHHVSKRKLHCMMLFNLGMYPDPNFYYLTKYDGYGCLILLKDREILLVPPMEYQRARKTVKGTSVKMYKKDFWDVLRKHARGKNIGLDYNSITLSFMKVIRKEMRKKSFVDISPVLREQRAVKTQDEIKTLKKACSISDKILKRFFSSFSRFRTEKQAAQFLETEAVKEGCGLSFPPIVASGSGAAEPHHAPKDTPIKKGFCIIDFGVKYNGYCSDTTRTVYVGKPSEKDKEIYNLLLNAQKDVVSSVRPGMRCSEPHKMIMHKLGDYGRYFIHGLGHGVGVEIHELPNLKPKSKEVFENGMVFTVEPGVYIGSRLGIRIEDTVLLDARPKVLTRISKDLRIIKKSG
ncbi:M24 family metallopeptidase [Candidatus Woesearchaeota archaeon]|nr:M24 family metallopeptidase [Candidatus Woesearchaeota archaeon]